jgi:hypothetical protein
MRYCANVSAGNRGGGGAGRGGGGASQGARGAHMRAHTRTRTHACSRTTHTRTRTRAYAHAHARTHTHARTRTHAHAHAHAHACAHTRRAIPSTMAELFAPRFWDIVPRAHISMYNTHTHTHTHTQDVEERVGFEAIENAVAKEVRTSPHVHRTPLHGQLHVPYCPCTSPAANYTSPHVPVHDPLDVPSRSPLCPPHFPPSTSHPPHAPRTSPARARECIIVPFPRPRVGVSFNPPCVDRRKRVAAR